MQYQSIILVAIVHVASWQIANLMTYSQVPCVHARNILEFHPGQRVNLTACEERKRLISLLLSVLAGVHRRARLEGLLIGVENAKQKNTIALGNCGLLTVGKHDLTQDARGFGGTIQLLGEAGARVLSTARVVLTLRGH